jgi:hypothetical protein
MLGLSGGGCVCVRAREGEHGGASAATGAGWVIAVWPGQRARRTFFCKSLFIRSTLATWHMSRCSRRSFSRLSSFRVTAPLVTETLALPTEALGRTPSLVESRRSFELADGTSTLVGRHACTLAFTFAHAFVAHEGSRAVDGSSSTKSRSCPRSRTRRVSQSSAARRPREREPRHAPRSSCAADHAPPAPSAARPPSCLDPSAALPAR